MAKKYKKSITRRWLVNSMGAVTAILFLIAAVLAIAVRSYYYSSVRQQLSSQMNVIVGAVTRYSEDISSNYSSELRGIIENYDKKRKEYTEYITSIVNK